MVIEFDRYRLSRFRILIGCLEITGGFGQILGLHSPLLKSASSLGLLSLMACGIWARTRINDPWFRIFPAAVLFLVNAWIFFDSLLIGKP